MRLGQVENVSHEKANYILGCSRKSNNGLREVVFPTLTVSESTSRVLSPILMHLVQERLANWCKSRGEHLKRVEEWSMHPTRRSQVCVAWKGENYRKF